MAKNEEIMTSSRSAESEHFALNKRAHDSHHHEMDSTFFLCVVSNVCECKTWHCAVCISLVNIRIDDKRTKTTFSECLDYGSVSYISNGNFEWNAVRWLLHSI